MQSLEYFIDEEAHQMLYENYIYDHMKMQRKEKINLLSSLVRQDLAEDFAKILSAANDLNMPEAKKISDILCFYQSDFLAIDENFNDYKKDFIKENNEKYYE